MKSIIMITGLISSVFGCLNVYSIQKKEVGNVQRLINCTSEFSMPPPAELQGDGYGENSYVTLTDRVKKCTSISGLTNAEKQKLVLSLDKLNKLIYARIDEVKLDNSTMYSNEFKKNTNDKLKLQIRKVDMFIGREFIAYLEDRKNRQQLISDNRESSKTVCLAKYPTLVGEDYEGYQNQLATYVKECESAVRSAVENNNSRELEAIRKAIKISISNIKQSPYKLGRRINGDNNTLDLVLSFNQEVQKNIGALEEFIETKSVLPLLANWRSEPFTYQFYAGAESNKVSGFSENSNARLGVLTYFRPGRKLQFLRNIVRECEFKEEWGWGPCGVIGAWPHWYFSANYSSSAEQSTTDNSEKAVGSAFEWETGVFWPWYMGIRGDNSDKTTEMMFGPIYSRGGRDVSSAERFLNRYYRGFRLAFNEESYFDIMQGHSEGLEDDRWEVRGQFPVTKFGSGRLFVGGNINFGHNDKGNANAKDSYKVYVMWQTSFDYLWSKKGND